ncbi:MAG: hypothetical protein ACKVU2_18300 [Saprospiraceae bacterium]
MAKKNKPKSKPKPDNSIPTVHADLRGMNITVNALGQIVKDYNIDDINAFLDNNVKDKKLDNETA